MTYRTQTFRSQPIRASLPGEMTLGYFAAAFFAFALVCDVAYVQTKLLMWRDFASWLLFAGLICGGLAMILWLIGFAVYRQRPAWGQVLLSLLIMAVALVNSLVHAGDGWSAIMPLGLGLSIATVVLMVIAGTLRRVALYPMLRA